MKSLRSFSLFSFISVIIVVSGVPFFSTCASTLAHQNFDTCGLVTTISFGSRKMCEKKDVPGIVQAYANDYGDTSSHKTKAKGILGEKVSELLFEKKEMYLSLPHFLKAISNHCAKACNLNSDLCETKYNSKNNGFDQIYVPVRYQRGLPHLDKTRHLVIAEAKFSSKNRLILAPTATKCQEMSAVWANENCQALIHKFEKIVKKPASSAEKGCAQQALNYIATLMQHLEEGKVLRAATVFDATGCITCYLIHDHGKPPLYGFSTAEAARELIEGLPSLAHA